MKMIVIGLGNFGLSISQKLTALGHEVIGVDKSMNRVEEAKNEMTMTVCLNPTDEYALRTLPIREYDAVIVAAGQDVGESVIITALVKQLGAQRLIVRSVSKVHENILSAIGVSEIIDVTTFASQTYSLKWSTKFARGLFMVDEKYGVFETELTPRLVGVEIKTLGLDDYPLQFIALKRFIQIKKVFSDSRSIYQVVSNADSNSVIQEKDRLVLYGKVKDFKHFTDVIKD